MCEFIAVTNLAAVPKIFLYEAITANGPEDALAQYNRRWAHFPPTICYQFNQIYFFPMTWKNQI